MARAACYLVAVPLTFHLARRIKSGGNDAVRITLIVLMFAYAIGSAANFLVSESLLHEPSATWVISTVSDGLLVVLALTTAVLLLFGRREEPGGRIAAVSGF